MSYRPSYENYEERERDSRPGGRYENDGGVGGFNRGARNEGDGYARSEGRRTQEGGPSEHHRREHEGYGNNDGFRSGDHPRQGGYGGENTYGSGPRRENSPGRSYGGNELGRREDRGHDSHGIGRRNEEDTYGHQQQPYREGGGSYDGRPNEESYGGRNSEGSSGPYRRDDGSSYGRSSGLGEHDYSGSGGSSRYENNERSESNQYRQQGQHTGTGGGAYGSSGYGNRNDSERRGEEGRKTTSETHTSTSNAEPHYGNEAAKAGADAARATTDYVDKGIEKLAERFGFHLDDAQADRIGDFARKEFQKLTGKEFPYKDPNDRK